MTLDVVSHTFAPVTLLCLETWTEHVARVLIKILARFDSFSSIIVNYFYRKIVKIGFLGQLLYKFLIAFPMPGKIPYAG